jgi:tetrapyrrole methylase family protein/MazG family protein
MQKSNHTLIAEILDLVQPALDAPLTILPAAACNGKHVPPFSPAAPALILGIASVDQLAQIHSLLVGFYAGGQELALISGFDQTGMCVETVTVDSLNARSHCGEAALYIPAVSTDASFDTFQEVIAHLRAPEGCPWDRKQTHISLRSGLLSEVYEVLDALDSGNITSLREELGDLLLQIVMQAQIAREAGEFSMVEVVQGISRKLVHRHPHVFGEVQVEVSENVLAMWEEIKAGEREQNGEAQEKGMLDGVSLSYPALAQADEYQDRVSRVGFDWDAIDGVWDKVFEELNELQQAQGKQEQTAELGDMLFALVNLARWLKIDAESALRETNQRFRRRFRFVEEGARKEGRSLQEMTLAEMDAYWDEAKRAEKGENGWQATA